MDAIFLGAVIAPWIVVWALLRRLPRGWRRGTVDTGLGEVPVAVLERVAELRRYFAGTSRWPRHWTAWDAAGHRLELPGLLALLPNPAWAARWVNATVALRAWRKRRAAARDAAAATAPVDR